MQLCTYTLQCVSELSEPSERLLTFEGLRILTFCFLLRIEKCQRQVRCWCRHPGSTPGSCTFWRKNVRSSRNINRERVLLGYIYCIYLVMYYISIVRYVYELPGFSYLRYLPILECVISLRVDRIPYKR